MKVDRAPAPLDLDAAPDLTPTHGVRLTLAAGMVACRTDFLAIATRTRARLPRMTLDEVALLDALVHETLEALADLGAKLVRGEAP
jgi:hypothetical protein